VFQEPLAEEEMRFFNVATAASITGYVRAFLWRTICALRRSGAEVFYCDTDSITFAGELPAEVKIGKELGEWSNDGEFTEGGIAGKKLYAFHGVDGEWKTGCKGVRLTPEELMKVAAGEVVKYEREAPSYSFGSSPRYLTRNVRKTGN
jgi:DNA polymerase elongation subunit (family B)